MHRMFKPLHNVDPLGEGGGPPPTPPATPPPPAAVSASPDAASSTGDTGATPSPTPTPAAPPPGLSRDEIKNIVQSAVGAVMPQQSAPALTQAEINERLRVFTPTSKHVAALTAGGEEAVQALNEIAQGIYQQAFTAATYMVQHHLGQIGQQLTPLQQHYQNAQMEEMKKEFLEKHQDLKGAEPLLMTVVGQLKAEGKSFEDRNAAYSAVAERARTILKSLPGMVPAKPAPAAGTPPPSSMSTPLGGGQGSGQPTGVSQSGPVPAWRALDL